jgi:hypothetical protein
VAVTTGPLVLLDTPHDGIQLAGSGLAIGDADRDNVLDPVDNCQTQSNARQLDDDHDGLGEDAAADTCDRTYCSDRVPGELVRLPAGMDEAVRYLKQRSDATLNCLNDLPPAVDRGGARVDVLCRGSFVAWVENPPLLADFGQVRITEDALLRELRGIDPGAAEERLAREALRALGESVIAVTRAPYGPLFPGHRLGDRTRAARHTVETLIRLVAAEPAENPQSQRAETSPAPLPGRFSRPTKLFPPTIGLPGACTSTSAPLFRNK